MIGRCSAKAPPRLRVSQWWDLGQFLTTTKTSSGAVKRVDWNVGSIDGARAQLDDLSLLRTVTFNPATVAAFHNKTAFPNHVLQLDPLAARGAFVPEGVITDAENRRPKNDPPSPEGKSVLLQGEPFYDFLVAECHRLTVQCLIGFGGHTSPPALDGSTTYDTQVIRAWSDWLCMENPTPSLSGLAVLVARDLLRMFPDCDGISFDVEGFTTNATSLGVRKQRLAFMQQNLADFYRELAANLQHRIVAVSTAGLTAADAVTGQGLGANLDQSLAQQFGLTARSNPHQNVILRPQGYEGFATKKTNADPDLKAWHEKVVDWAATDMGRANAESEFQLGIALFTKSGRGVIADPTVIEARCRNLLRPHGSGIIFFGGQDSKKWELANRALNSSTQKPVFTTCPPGTIGSPQQVPLTAEAMKRLRG